MVQHLYTNILCTDSRIRGTDASCNLLLNFLGKTAKVKSKTVQEMKNVVMEALWWILTTKLLLSSSLF